MKAEKGRGQRNEEFAEDDRRLYLMGLMREIADGYSLYFDNTVALGYCIGSFQQR